MISFLIMEGPFCLLTVSLTFFVCAYLIIGDQKSSKCTRVIPKEAS